MESDLGSGFLVGHHLSSLCPERRTCWDRDELRGPRGRVVLFPRNWHLRGSEYQVQTPL